MSVSQLQTVLRVETEREQVAAKRFIASQQHHQTQRQKLQQLQQYRTDYIEQIKKNGSSGYEPTRYQQHLSFVGKLDLACEQQLHVIARANMAMEQSKADWLKKQQRKEAIIKLLEKQEQEIAYKNQRIEQQDMDEFSNQQYLRRKKASNF
jgi:flagellar FliJ protein